MAQNRISWGITPEEMTAVMGAIESIEGNLAALSTLPADEKIPVRMGPKSVDFVSKAHEYGTLYSAIVPGHVDLAEMDKDLKASEALTSIQRRLAVLLEKIDDNRALAGSEAFAQARDIYNAAKRAADSGVAGAKTASDDLRVRYPGNRGDQPFVTPAPG